jgi:hypothetical protein
MADENEKTEPKIHDEQIDKAPNYHNRTLEFVDVSVVMKSKCAK